MRKLLIANRGEIAIRAARAAREFGVASVAVYSHEDRSALHRQVADEAYQIGVAGHPVRSYLDIDALIAIARKSGADAVYPGYGFLSESAVFAQAVVDAGLTWVGPSPATLLLTGDKVRARESAERAGVPVLSASGPVASVAEAVAEAERIGLPVFVKASGGGGGRGLRRVDTLDEVRAVFDTARREAAAAFGDDTLFVEQAVIRPRHVEVQVLADASGGVVHLFERDCSVQRRHQKVVEIAPAPGLPRDLVESLCADAVAYARQVDYCSAGTVEFLVWADPQARAARHVSGFGYAFIEMNPRIQVEHTVTEEVTGIDLVLAQLRIAAGEDLAAMGLVQEAIRVQRSAIQCRITTEDPSDDFRPSTGTIVAYRSPGGPGIRLDGSAYVGAEVSPFYDSLLVKMTASGPDFAAAARRARRGLSDFVIRGVASNVHFLQGLLASEDFLSGDLTTAFLDEHPDLLGASPGAHLGEAGALLLRLAETTVNRPHGTATTTVRDPADRLPKDGARPGADGDRQGPARHSGTDGSGGMAAVTHPGRGDRHDTAGRAPVAAGHARPHDRPGGGRGGDGQTAAGTVQPGVLGRCDLRCGVAVPGRGPVGAPGTAAGRRAGNADADADPRPQRPGLRPLPRPCCHRVRRARPRRRGWTSSGYSTRSTTWTGPGR